MLINKTIRYFVIISLLLCIPYITVTADTITENGMNQAEEFTIDSLPNNEELFEGYLDQKFSPSKEIKAQAVTNTRRSTLSGTEAIVYDMLKEKIFAVADGELASTSFSLPFAEIFGSEAGRFYSASELGVSAIVENGAITSAAKAAIKEKYAINYQQVIRCLAADFPYQLYWFKKNVQSKYDNGVYRVRGEGGEYRIALLCDSYTCIFTVGREYSLTGEAGTTDVDISKTSISQTAVANAKSIVRKHSTESDYAKLNSYKQEICDLVSYNHYASDNKIGSDGYVNPWQLIWVFDEDPSTEVVCEGYAKAFQYLCDLSTFRSPLIECYCVSGNVDGSSTGHMWNIVTMDNGQNYLVDVTNCDTSSVGAADLLFLVNPLSGSVSTGYTFDVISKRKTYKYADHTLSIYGEDVLKLANTEYSSSVSHDHNWYAISFEKNDNTLHKHLYKCKDCGKTKYEMEPHTATGIAISYRYIDQNSCAGKYKCKDCGAYYELSDVHNWKTESTKSISLYDGSTHQIKRYKTCTHCDKTVAYTEFENHNLGFHKMIYKGENCTYYGCDTCKFVYNNRVSSNRTIKTVLKKNSLYLYTVEWLYKDGIKSIKVLAGKKKATIKKKSNTKFTIRCKKKGTAKVKVTFKSGVVYTYVFKIK